VAILFVKYRFYYLINGVGFNSFCMKKIIFLLCVVFVTSQAHAQFEQYIISGRVIDGTTKLPLQGASVFAQNTTIGTATDQQGNFNLRLLNGGYDLIITFTGYQTANRRITTADALDKNIVIEIAPKEKALEDVVIKSSNEVKDGLEKYGSFFEENFIGKTANSSQCIIKNKEVLHFYYYKKKNRLKVLATGPLEIENTALGYAIKYTLDSFTHEYASQLNTYSGYPLFKDLQPLDEAQKTTWYKNRLKAYQGSMLHFMRSVHDKKIKEEGFEIQLVAKANEVETAIPVQDFYGALNYAKNDSSQVVEILPNQPNLAVLYNKQAPDPLYISSTGDVPRKFQLSIVTFAPDQSLGIEQNGYFFDQNDIVINGYWTWQKVADVLPYDFRPQ
jgi:hypothetical protein